MAERRMFAKTIIDSDLFLDMPLTTQALYFHLSMRADDDGFINNPKKILRMIGCNEDELKLLIIKQFVIPFETGVCVIKHWRIHNWIRKDRYNETICTNEKSQLILTGNNEYKKISLPDGEIRTGIPNDNQVPYQMDTQDSLDNTSLDNTSLDNNSIPKGILSSTKVQLIIEKWNKLNLQKLISIKTGTNRYKLLKSRANEYGIDSIFQAIENVSKSNFLKGQNDRGWIITFDWLIKPNNFIKVLEGNYTNHEGGNNGYNATNSKSNKYNIEIPKPRELTEEEKQRAQKELI